MEQEKSRLSSLTPVFICHCCRGERSKQSTWVRASHFPLAAEAVHLPSQLQA